jgi:hypothetical protein
LEFFLALDVVVIGVSSAMRVVELLARLPPNIPSMV